MKRDKKWILKTLEGVVINDDYGNAFNGGYEEGLNTAYELALQLDEPEKVVIPQFVADYLETAKKEISLLRVFEIANGLNELDMWRKEYNWIRLYHLDFARAWLDGYEIKKEKKYLVEDNHYALLCKFEGKVISTHKSENDDLPIECLEFEFTEKEIKDYDHRYWAFAQPVEETP